MGEPEKMPKTGFRRLAAEIADASTGRWDDRETVPRKWRVWGCPTHKYAWPATYNVCPYCATICRLFEKKIPKGDV